MHWMRSPLFWKITGGYALISGVALGGLLLASNQSFIQNTGALGWLLSIAGFGYLAAKLTAPLRSLTDVMQNHAKGHAARDAMMRLSERTDDFGEAARRLMDLDAAHQQQLDELSARERDARASAIQMSAMLQSMVEGVVAVDVQERILFANNVFCSMFDIDPKTVEGRRIFEAVRNPHVQEVVHEAVTDRQAAAIEFRLLPKEIRISLSIAPISGSGAVLVLNDVSEVRRLEAMRREFVSSVSHELKTPLTVIQACTETLLDGAAEDPGASQKFLRRIEEQSERLLQLIMRMLHLARVESGEETISRQPVDLVAVSRQVISSLMPVADSKGISLSQTGKSELYVLADDQALATVVSNLVDNSLKYTPDQGAVQVSVDVIDDAAVIKVTDSGVGIPKADQERVFERFYRVDRDRSRERGGTGLGLAIVKHLCQAMDAELSLSSSAGQGCTFTVRFPFPE